MCLWRGRCEAGWDVLRADRLARHKALGLVPADTARSPPTRRPEGLASQQKATPCGGFILCPTLRAGSAPGRYAPDAQEPSTWQSLAPPTSWRTWPARLPKILSANPTPAS